MRLLYLFNLPLSIVTVLATPAITDSVYNPARAFLGPKSNGGLAYLFLPTTTAPSIYEFLSLNTSATLVAASLPYSTLSAAYKSPGNPQNTTFTPFMDKDGDVFVHTGSCSSGASGSSLWRYTPEPNANNGNGSWGLQNVKTEALDGSGILSGANYLSSGIAFSGVVGKDNEDASLYVFGGMCPFAHSSSGSWTADAQYSNSMLTFSPTTSSSDSSPSEAYTMGLSQSRGPPIPEAGFSITPLSPTFSDQSTGIKSQQQNFVLVGGHTQTAFINMSQVALFSLPVQSWSFLTVNPPSANAKTDLTARGGIANVDPRSGHTSVLTEDGKTMIVFGGWVGDVHTPANPQLAVLEVGEDYGGTGDWAWRIPSQSGKGLAEDSGIYGHAAVMLPGGVMMVVGGYSISPPPSSNSKDKRNNAAQNTQNLFYNTTSSTWISTYKNPTFDQHTSTSTNPPGGAQDEKSGLLSSTSQKAGLGVGLVLGLLLVISAAIVYLWFARRRKRQRDARDKELRDLASGADRFQLSRADTDGEKSAADWTSGRPRHLRNHTYTSAAGDSVDGHGWRNSGVIEAERTGLLVEIPSPTRGLRRSLHSRGTYQPAPRFEDGRRRSIGPGSIHPIDERDEYEYSGLEVLSTRRSDDVVEDIQPIATSPGPTLDPFRDPNPLRSHPIASPMPSTAHDRQQEVQNWVSDWAAADAIMHNPARTPSPDKDRTSSTLSEQSTRSTGSNQSIAFSRSLSQRSAALFTAVSNPFSSPNTSPTHDQHLGGGRCSPPHNRRSQSLIHFSNRPGTSNTNDSFATAATSFQQLQTEGEALLGGRPTDNVAAPESPTKIKGRSIGWMGSMRRALPLSLGGERSVSPSSASGGRSSASPSPTKYHDALPRRAASASAATLWRKKQGAADWDAEMNNRQLSPSPEGVEGEGDEWDVEAAVERRVVQVMFTVPKEKLRVVNAGDADGASVSDIGEEDFLDKGKGKGVAKRGTF
ncbi:MAG: hypothetical protein M1812_005588 [Candelaria pacifica]|nr:MAG: hypothetical protein M1812_005588 [Candelaria pacifica]